MNLFRLPCGIPWGGARRLVLTLACLFALSGLSAQNVTLRFERAKLKTVMDEITRQCDLSSRTAAKWSMPTGSSVSI